MGEIFSRTLKRSVSILPWAFASLACWLSYRLFQTNRSLRRRLSTLEQQELEQIDSSKAQTSLESVDLFVGTPAPDFELRDIAGERRRLSEWRGRQLLLIFFDPDCVFCAEMNPSLSSLSADGSDDSPVALLITVGSLEKNRQLAAAHGVKCPVLLQEQLEVMLEYGVPGTPAGYLIDENGLIASEQILGAQALLQHAGISIKDESAQESAHQSAAPAADQVPSQAQRGKRPLAESRLARQGLAKGEVAPLFNLPRLGGGELRLEEYRGKSVLLVFSDPECGPCNQLAPRLEKLSRRVPDIHIIMISRGGVEANGEKALEHGLTFPILMQRHWEISRLYAMFATPIAYLIDEQGMIAANVAAGIEPILNLLISAAIISLLKETKPSSDASVEAGTASGESILTQ